MFLRGLPRAGAGWILAAAFCCASSSATAATQEELEARIDALAQQLEAVKQELAALKRQRENTVTAGPAAGLPDAGRTPGAQESATPSESVGYGPATRSNAVTFWGYGELNYSRPSAHPSAAVADLTRFVLGAGYEFNESTRFNSELEVEHAVSSASDSGEVEVEQAYIEHELTRGLFTRVGLVLIPSGTLNENHEPTRYYGVFRNFVETAIIPSTWREGGVTLQGFTSGGLRWDVGVTTGFDLSKWNAASLEGQASPLGSVHQELQLAHAHDLSGFAALNYTGISGLRVGASLFGGGASQGQPGVASSTLTLWETHLRWGPGPWDLAALYARGHLSNTGELNRPLTGGVSLIPASFFGWYLQAACRVFETENASIAPFVRYERLNTGAAYEDFAATVHPSALPEQRVWTSGVNWTIAPGVVIKADYLSFQGTGTSNRFDLGAGYQF